MPVAIKETKPATPAKMKLLDVEAVLGRLSLPDKVALLSGKDNWHTKDFVALGVPSLRLSDGPNGCRGTKFFEGVPAASFPCATGLASSWDIELLDKVGAAIGEECRAKGVHVLLAPTVNQHRTPLNGRGFESFSEDPLLSGKLAGSFIRGCQATGVAAALKHLVCNDQETKRVTEVDERTLREIYLKPFEIAIREADPWLVMTSYNRLNGLHCSETKRLISGILRDEWGFTGAVVSDWHGTYSTDEAIHAGLDLEMPGPSIIRGPALLRMVTCGKVTEDEITERARQVLCLVNRCIPSSIPSMAEERENPDPALDTLRESAASAVVLLKNDTNTLPISRTARRIAVIGPNAGRACIFGGGSAELRPTYSVSPLEGIRKAAGSACDVVYAAGCDAHKLTPLLGERMTNSRGAMGFDISFYNEPPDRHQKAIHSLSTSNSNMFFNDNLPDSLDRACYATITGHFTPERSGVYEFGIGALGVVDMYIDDVLFIDNTTNPTPGELFYGKGSREETSEAHLQAGIAYSIRLEYASPSASTSFVGPLALSSRGGVRFGGYLKLSPEEHLKEAVELAQSADAVVLVAGLNSEFETEGFDRADMALPPASLNLIEKVLAVRPDTIICVQSGTPVEMPFASQTSSLIQLFYNGNEIGNGLADVLFGDVNPSAKLPFTIPKKLQDCASHAGSTDMPGGLSFPGKDGKVYYQEGVFMGYRQFVSGGPEPAFAFGHGLSYSDFSYTSCQISRNVMSSNPNTIVRCTITNSGSTPGREIVQTYVSAPLSSISRPSRELRGFTKTKLLQPGESQVVSIRLDQEAFAYHGEKGWTVEKGEYQVLVGASSVDIRETISVTIEEDFVF
ncbi:hypothetical protein L202_03326 [Cryptococcus amylolentus CBS 6039]|uniref:beta-glucosidase n=1 Tax=Cryptococcus amylolentus CBS 6039 TaxID=1295533 RepID=A0A1E3HSK7_9TREE|nr:hypothetical protein L202_03326 [Cryptococcus amylolentus CBS 6039]ODN79317.1 hypothetical protein L202_03326 [Cryptococcus amylolentus CBS 6039]